MNVAPLAGLATRALEAQRRLLEMLEVAAGARSSMAAPPSAAIP
jgi:hypothetical protein